MRYAEFARRFRDHQEIGREVTDARLLVFYDNGKEVGLWREDRRTTQGTGEVLGPQDAAMARYWYRHAISKWIEAEQSRRTAGASAPDGPPKAVR